MDLVKFGMSSADLAQKIEEHGLDFEPTDAYLDELRKAGAKEEVIQAIRGVKPKPLNREQVGKLVAGHVPNERVTVLVKQRGIDFQADDKYLQTLRLAGADASLIAALREASAAMTAELIVVTSPDADVSLDGTSQGRADSQGQLAIKAMPGIHGLKVTHDGKKAFELNVNLVGGQTARVDASLADAGAHIEVKRATQAQGNTICLLVETRGNSWKGASRVLRVVEESNLVQPNDSAAAITFNMQPQILTDFGPGLGRVKAAFGTIQVPFSIHQSNLNDAVAFALGRMKSIQGRKAIVLICTGRDSISKLDDATLSKVAQSSDTPLYAISIAGFVKTQDSAEPAMERTRLDNLANLSKGRAYYPTSDAEISSDLNDIAESLKAF